ncbi:hypothetical protein [Acinetobacter sp. ANC 4973]|uniref:hypothetical protein n=1 Tax=Acinetobacter sp. ANC 4973 TaxID=1977871 RepID=UPI000A33EB96|nr:hypothetical protein [Acinetobacter sp. ANC 4973]OTH00994.1 hypothetical protein B9T30_02730 [Acinetobacter sp. ANC 4973]
MNERFTDDVRNKKIELNCTEILIYQNKGMCLKGYGKIKINSVGTIYLDFICQSAYNLPEIEFFSTKYPKNDLIAEQVFNLIGKTLDGRTFTSKSFNVKLNHQIYLLPIQIYIFLSYIEFSEKVKNEISFLYLETQQILEIPSNTITSTIGDSRSERNETIFSLFNDNLKFRYVKNYQNKSYIELIGNFQTNRTHDCLRLYYGLTTGCLLQFYYSFQQIKKERIQRINSINTNKIDHRFFQVCPTNISVDNKLSLDFHENFLVIIFKLAAENENIFNSVFEQWSRLWDASRSTQQILNLVITTSVEGLLNDIFIPIFEEDVDQKLLDEISNIKNIIKALDINHSYKQRLHNSISYLKNITANKALNLLVIKKVLTKDEVKVWKELRNEVAHPKNKILDIDDQKKVESNFLLCLNLFNNLIFQALRYDGVRYYFTNEDSPKITEFKHCQDLLDKS